MVITFDRCSDRNAKYFVEKRTKKWTHLLQQGRCIRNRFPTCSCRVILCNARVWFLVWLQTVMCEAEHPLCDVQQTFRHSQPDGVETLNSIVVQVSDSVCLSAPLVCILLRYDRSQQSWIFCREAPKSCTESVGPTTTDDKFILCFNSVKLSVLFFLLGRLVCFILGTVCTMVHEPYTVSKSPSSTKLQA